MKAVSTAFKLSGITLVACCALVLPLAGGERENLLETFKKEQLEAEKLFQEAVTMVDITAAAGNYWNVAEKQYFRALEYKLRQTSDLRMRLELLKDAHELSREVQRVFDTPREGKGSSIGMHIYNSIAGLFNNRTAILMLDAETEKRWQRISAVPFYINGQRIQPKLGKGEFSTVMYDTNVRLEFFLSPGNSFSFQNRDFAVIRTDIPFAGNDDFSTVYLLELKNGQLQVHTKCKFPCFSKWELKGAEFIICNGKNMQKIRL